jgi:Double zinc ribbon
MEPSQKPENELDPNHQAKRSLLRMLAVVVVAAGGVFTVIGFASFFFAFSTHEFPKFFWCAFVGLPLLGFGMSLVRAAYVGAAARYLAGEIAPVGKDTFNYMADGTKQSVKTIATAVGEGLAAGAAGASKSAPVHCSKCNQANDPAAQFCKSCGAPLAKTKPCPACHELNDADARFCDHCGHALA